MKKRWLWVLPICLSSVLSLRGQAPFPAGLDGELYYCPRIDLVPAGEGGPLTVTLDGILDEPVWKRAAFHTVNTVLETGVPLELDPPELDWSMIYACCADQDFLYVAWKVVDDTLIAKQPGNTGCDVWKDDSVEFYIDALNNGPSCPSDGVTCYVADDAQITVGADQIGNEPGNPEQPDCPEDTPVEECLKIGGVAGKPSCDFGGPAPGLVKGVVQDLQHGDLSGTFGDGLTGWQAEIAIALDTLGNGDDGTPTWTIVPDHGTCLGWSAQGNDDDSDEIPIAPAVGTDRDHKLAWAKREVAESAWRNPGVFGKLSFFDPTKPTQQGVCALPVDRLACNRRADGSVLVTWRNPGTASDQVPTKILVDGVEKATVPGNATQVVLAEADVPRDGVDHVISVKNNSDETPPTCTIVQAPIAECGGIRFWNVLIGFERPGGAAPGDEEIRKDYMTDGTTGELDFEWKAGATIQTEFGGAAASTGIKKNVLAPVRNPGFVPTVFEWKDTDSRIVFQEMVRVDWDDVMAYAQTYVINNTGGPLDVSMGISSDDSVQVLLNGDETWINNIPRPGSDACTPQDRSPDGFIFTETHVLAPGSNSLILKVFDGTGGWEFAFRFQDESGEPITEGLDISLVPPPPPVKETNCTNGTDDDGDTQVDCDDADCAADLACQKPQFHRGDADTNGELQLTDAVRILNVLFLGTGVLPCRDAADADDNGALQLTDAVRILNVLFLGTGTIPPPGAPTEACGEDPGTEHLGCDAYPALKC